MGSTAEAASVIPPPAPFDGARSPSRPTHRPDKMSLGRPCPAFDGKAFLPPVIVQVFFPVGHQLPTLLKSVTSAVGSFDLVANSMSQRSFGNLARDIGLPGRPVSEGRSESMDHVVDAHSAEHHLHRHG